MKSASDILADPALADYIGSEKAVAAAKILGGAARFAPWLSAPLGALATVGHARDIAEANERGDTLQALSSTAKTALAGVSSIPVVGILPYLAELGLEGAEEIRNRFFPFDAEKEAAATMGYMKPEEFGLDPFTNEQIREARATFQRLMEETPEEVSQYISPTADPYIYQDQIAEALQKAQAEQTLFTGDEVDVASRAPVNLAEILRTIPAAPAISREQEIENMMREDREEQLKFHPSSPLYEAPFEEGTGPGAVSPEQPIAQAVAQALANTDQPVQQNLQALVELAQTDPSIADRYVPGSQALQDITTQVESFSEPTVEWTPPTASDRKKDRAIEKAAEASRKAEAKREADTKKKAAEQRAALDSASQRALQNHMAWMATQAAQRAEEERLRALRGYGSGDMWT